MRPTSIVPARCDTFGALGAVSQHPDTVISHRCAQGRGHMADRLHVPPTIDGDDVDQMPVVHDGHRGVADFRLAGTSWNGSAVCSEHTTVVRSEHTHPVPVSRSRSFPESASRSRRGPLPLRTRSQCSTSCSTVCPGRRTPETGSSWCSMSSRMSIVSTTSIPCSGRISSTRTTSPFCSLDHDRRCCGRCSRIRRSRSTARQR